MSDTSIHFLFKIESCTVREYKWLGDNAQEADDLTLSQLTEFDIAYEDYANWPGFNITPTWNKPEKTRTVAIFSGGVNTNAIYTAEFIKTFLRLFRPKKYITFEWAYTDEQTQQYGGGAYFVTSTHYELVGTLDWMRQKEDEWKAKHNKK